MEHRSSLKEKFVLFSVQHDKKMNFYEAMIHIYELTTTILDFSSYFYSFYSLPHTHKEENVAFTCDSRTIRKFHTMTQYCYVDGFLVDQINLKFNWCELQNLLSISFSEFTYTCDC